MAAPYFYQEPRDEPDGEFAEGTPVVLMVYHGGDSCRVVDEHGLYVETACAVSTGCSVTHLASLRRPRYSSGLIRRSPR